MDSLFQLTGKAMQLIQLASSSDEEDRQVFADTLEGVMGEIEAKADDYAYVMTMIKGKADIVSAEINRLKAIEDALNASYTKIEIQQKPDNDKIRQALKEGKELDFAKFGERGTHLKID